jgi:hypothetical protein
MLKSPGSREVSICGGRRHQLMYGGNDEITRHDFASV